MKILFIAPIPPPTNGQSLASEVLYKKVKLNNKVALVDMAKKKRPTNIWHQIQRSYEVMNFFIQVLLKKRNAQLVYFTISESIAGNIKDIFIYIICFGKLKHTFIHMLGGAGMNTILEKKGVLYTLNKFFVSRVRGVIVEGKNQERTFSQLIGNEKIHVVPNFAEDFLFVSEQEVIGKFEEKEPLKILFLSNLIFGKGYNELADAFLSLDDSIKQKIQIHFVGGFQSDDHRNAFFKKIEGQKGLIYYGKFASGEKKKALYMDSHIFCLPTYYPYEGQPISILEAYATGCAVITTYHSGIPEVFADGINGFVVEKKSVDSLRETLEKMVRKSDDLLAIALTNRNVAYNKYRTSIYCSTVTKILDLHRSKK